MVSNDNEKERRFQIFLPNICIYIYSQTGVNDHSEGCERRKIGKESRVWSGVNELMTSRLYIQMEIVERITSIPHCIIQFYRIIQWDIRYLSSRGSIWLRYGPWRHQFTDSAIFSPILLLPRKRKFSRRRRRGRDDTRDTHTHIHESMYGGGCIICAEHVLPRRIWFPQLPPVYCRIGRVTLVLELVMEMV